MNVAAVVLARMDSARLPGKAMRLVRGLPVIHYVIARAQRIAGAEAVLATTARPADDALAAYAAQMGVRVYRGSASDVAGRMLGAALDCGADAVVRVNGDSVFADPELIGEGLRRCGEADFVTNLIGRTFPYGVSVEIVKTETYQRACTRITTAQQREHPTSVLYEHADDFSVATLLSPHPELKGARLVIDTAEDLEAFRRLTDELGERVLAVGYREAAARYLEATATR